MIDCMCDSATLNADCARACSTCVCHALIVYHADGCTHHGRCRARAVYFAHLTPNP
jgi:hypothetical protein